ncbi:hybrid sensor histidine kinase/response regulator [Thiocapsa imhoffii]|uniref:histidine kinase n=1 Tax=Thiocapsa imhoffii TaxID=382777 RepID=A0A9X1B7U3_9GAMM|nr:ATP-binding protein [Thiocapsa imhoffii]MBK1644087.1 hybrid sensor histidine kinase/response regulator [Thiocapsa imhoffii]
MNGLLSRHGGASSLLGNPEFQSALVRISACLIGALYIALGAVTQYYEVDVPYYLTLFGLYLCSNVGFLISIAQRPHWTARIYVGIVLDIGAISLAIFITREAISPFYLLYILVFISAATRFGKRPLTVAAASAVVAYNSVLIALDQWGQHPFEAAFFLVLLALLPLYQYSLLHKVQDARAEAEKANQAKGDFLAFMTHELRTPLTGVMGMTELLKGTRLDAEQQDYVEAIAHSADVLGALIGDILDFSKIDARQLQLERMAFDPRMPVRDVCGALGHRVRAAGLELICDVDPAVPPEVSGDLLRVRQILFNLVGNAVKFTETGEIRVCLSVRPAEAEMDCAHLLFEVIDTGIGIAPEKLPNLFESFRQADESTTRRFGGTGLGTTIARELTVLMGGTIGVDSTLGRGSRFWVRLPLLADAAPASPVTLDRLHGRRILLLEHNDTARELALTTLRREGAICVGAADPAALAGQAADLLVIADHPGGSDVKAARVALKTPVGDALTYLFLIDPGQRPRELAPHHHCLTKPYLPEDLLAAVLACFAPSCARVAVANAGPGNTPLNALAPLPGAAQHPVLVAEDNAIAARVITSFLSKMGFPITQVADGEAALAEALTGVYDMAIVDLRMPKLDGIGFTRRYRETVGTRPMPILALTANASEDVKQQCLAAGMDAFLSKPVRPDELRRTLLQML